MLLAIDRDTMVDSIFLGYATPGTTVFPETSPWHYEPSASELMSFNVTAANELLESSGYVDVDSDGVRECTDISQAVQMGWVDEGTELNFTVPVFKPDGPEAKDIADYLKAAWSEIGVQGQYEVIDFTFYPMLCPIQQDVSVSWWHTLYPDPELMLFTQSSLGIGGWSDTEFSNASYDENFTRSVSAIDTGAREVYIDNCQRILYDQCPYSVLAYPNSNYAWRNDSIKGWGDWEAHPGRSLDAFWGANPLFFNLTDQWYTTESDSAFLTPSSVLNLVIVVAVAGTILVTYFVWKRLSHPERPPKTE